MVKLLYGLDTINDRLIHIDNYDLSSKQYLVCPECGRRLSAKCGQIREHHFAHYHDGDKVNCNWKPESIIHRRAKEILKEHSEILLPDYNVSIESFSEQAVIKKFVLKYERCVLEKYVRSDLKPDAILSTNNLDLYVEIVKTHGIDEFKRQKLNEMGKPVLAIDVSSFVDHFFQDADLVEAVIKTTENKTIILPEHPVIKLQKRVQQMYEELVRNYSTFYGQFFDESIIMNLSCSWGLPHTRRFFDKYYEKKISAIEFLGLDLKSLLRFTPLLNLESIYQFLDSTDNSELVCRFIDRAIIKDGSGIDPSIVFSNFVFRLPVIQGTELQIKWANELRKEHLDACLRILQKHIHEADELKHSLFSLLVKEFWEISKERNTLTATYWINNRPENKSGMRSYMATRYRDEYYYNSSRRYLKPWPFIRNYNQLINNYYSF